jgi:hypothetical protein
MISSIEAGAKTSVTVTSDFVQLQDFFLVILSLNITHLIILNSEVICKNAHAVRHDIFDPALQPFIYQQYCLGCFL